MGVVQLRVAPRGGKEAGGAGSAHSSEGAPGGRQQRVSGRRGRCQEVAPLQCRIGEEGGALTCRPCGHCVRFKPSQLSQKTIQTKLNSNLKPVQIFFDPNKTFLSSKNLE
jgi:hypothetical protein